MMMAHRLLLLAVVMLPPGQAIAQESPWPTNPPPAAVPAPWPTDPPQAAAPAPRPSDPAQAAASGSWSFGGEGGIPPCKAEFAKLREEVQKLGLAAKAAGQRKASRDEMCKHITAYSVGELKWVKYTEANVTSCNIPSEVLSQLKQVHSNTEQTKEKICAAGPVGPAGWQSPGGSIPKGYSID